jgi:hypothetical protein
MAVALTIAGCSDPNYAEGLTQPPTAGVPSVGAGSGKTLAAHLHYTMQKKNPAVHFEKPSCPDVSTNERGAIVTCTMRVDGEKQQYKMTMGKDGRWDISDG